LPRLITGIPINEMDYGFNEVNAAYEALGITREGGNYDRPNSDTGDRTFALSQALCTSKATQAQVDYLIMQIYIDIIM
jgi:hypothetical protein